jgi:glycosyltransferase involved in cell wall biosynthesis
MIERLSARTRRRPRLLRVITRLNVGGPSRHVLLADRGLQERGWETLLVHGEVDEGEAEVALEHNDLPRLRLTSLRRPIRPTSDAKAIVSLVSVARNYRPDVIHTHLSKAGMLGRLAGMLAYPRARRVHTFHGNLFGQYFGAEATNAIIVAERFLGHRTHLILALSDVQRSELLAHRVAPPDRITIVPLGLDFARFGRIDRPEARRRLGIPQAQSVIVTASRMVPIKRLDRLIDAFGVVRRSHPAHLYLIGDGTDRPAVEARVREAGLDQEVSFIGWVDEVADWYAAADVVALTSDREGTPLALIEAAAAARPVVATDVGGVRDVVVDGQTGFVVDADDIAAFADRVARLLADPRLAEQLGAAAPSQSTAFAGQRLIDDLDAVYRKLLRPARVA